MGGGLIYRFRGISKMSNADVTGDNEWNAGIARGINVHEMNWTTNGKNHIEGRDGGKGEGRTTEKAERNYGRGGGMVIIVKID